MAIVKRKRRAKPASMWIATQDLPRSAAHPFYARLNQILDQHDLDGFVAGLVEGKTVGIDATTTTGRIGTIPTPRSRR